MLRIRSRLRLRKEHEANVVNANTIFALELKKKLRNQFSYAANS